MLAGGALLAWLVHFLQGVYFLQGVFFYSVGALLAGGALVSSAPTKIMVSLLLGWCTSIQLVQFLLGWCT